MKKIFSCFFILLVLVSFVSAAQMSIRPQIGLGLGAGKEQIIITGYSTGSDRERSSTGTLIKDEIIIYSGGSGLKLGIGFDYELNPNMSAELSGFYSIGFETEISKYDNRATQTMNTAKVSTSFLPFSLTLKVKTKINAITPYAGFGPTIALGPKSSFSYTETDPTTTTAIEGNMYYKTAIGFHGVLGADYELNSKMSLFVQTKIEQLSFTPSKSELTTYTVNGVNQLPLLTTREKEVEYLDDIGGIISDPNKPAVELARPGPANSFTISAGIAYMF